ncbi:hypothetical protein ACQR0Z_27575 [Bradyrhizobium sp. HKCCYLS3077]|uniref:hypothetical protein n=1 Tax=Bradyrhizobium sp. HKCCYLS3077 TaxID=3420761 RepID=UPI003EBBEC3B
MDIVLYGMLGLLVASFYFAWSCGRSYFARGRNNGIEDAVRELIVGMAPHLAKNPGPDIQAALKNLNSNLAQFSDPRQKRSDPTPSLLWVLGAALAEECWRTGHGAGVRRKAPTEGQIRVDLSPTELLQLGGLANLGFQHMMPNTRIIAAHRFVDIDDARDASRSLSKVEAAIPSKYRPDLLAQAEARENLIKGWWRPAAHRSTA